MSGARGRLHKTAESNTPRRSARRGRSSQQDNGVPVVFQEMLYEEQASQAASIDDDERPLKKRKTVRPHKSESPIPQPQPVHPPTSRAPRPPSPTRPHIRTAAPFQAPLHTRAQSTTSIGSVAEDEKSANARVVQTIIDSDESDGSDMEWEDALGDEDGTEDDMEDIKAAPQIDDISITIGGKKAEEMAPKRRVRRRAITSVDKKRRLDIHKMHLLCLLYHVHRRNAWCNDRRVQSTLRKLVPPKTLTNLVPDPDITQYSASKRFVDGMNELKILWAKRFKITAQGMYKPRWAEADADIRPFSDFDELDDPMDKDDFRNAAHTLHGSQDVGTQLFCALLRGIGIEARLVCSLQPLPFASAAERATPQKPSASKTTIVVDPYNKPAETTPTRPRTHAPPRPKKLSRLERVMGERHAVLNKTGAAPKKQKAYHTPFPVYWVEAFNSAHQKWVPIDTHSTFTVNAPEKLEPPLNFVQNSLTYAIAFDEDYIAKDVTRRYAKAYNAKTRKFRVECTPDGDKWWRRAVKFFRSSTTLDRDQLEDATLARKEAAEGIPRNVQDFKGHPVYVLERHLRYNEVIHPLNQVGRVNCGTAMNPKMEPIYRRTNVHIVRSSDKWYRMGRDVKGGEQPLKHAKPKKGARRPSIGPDMDVDEQTDEAGAGLYAEFQTELYVPPPVTKGRVPRNVYGNLDLYVPSMCPPGGTHIRHKLASKAARIVGVDFADAVTGFSFKGRHGTAIVQGVVVASEYADAVQAVIGGMEYQQEAAEVAARRSESLRLWRRFFLGLRIAQRVNAIVIDGEKGPVIDVQDAINREDKSLVEKEMAGGFFPDEDDFADAEPSRGYEPPQQDYGNGGFLPDTDFNDGSGGFVPDEVGHLGALSLNRQHSFESSILDSQQLRPRRRSSFGEVYSSDDDDDEDRRRCR
ncbi:Rad4-domain-containing protein [Cucurbitaria berberidis CBS 394.84]|uniref:Rad4-domain-containing protein n=1 Tax=Cucurbitaria berberidis CBS 394.84 TaxID=1168544 RepID=A0A9P4GG91_9PLEO|nr:Rad4-domain-containing protein [Cucurbitaria berberidis CBS 394.84]KAF1845523.1 Rad4-domain-containing protein [Cucurbitaria berberidis CBS 394.84]